MKIDHLQNPLGIVKRFRMPYAEGKYELEGRIHGITDEGFDEANWFEISVVYPSSERRKHPVEMIPELNNYEELRRGAPTLEEAEERLLKWCSESNLNAVQATPSSLKSGTLT